MSELVVVKERCTANKCTSRSLAKATHFMFEEVSALLRSLLLSSRLDLFLLAVSSDVCKKFNCDDTACGFYYVNEATMSAGIIKSVDLIRKTIILLVLSHALSTHKVFACNLLPTMLFISQTLLEF